MFNNIDQTTWLVYFIPLTFFSFIIASLFIYIFMCKRKLTPQDDIQGFIVIEFLESLIKLCPIGIEKKWELLHSNYGPPRCWLNKFSFPSFNFDIKLHGATAVAPTSPQKAINMISDPSKWDEWEPIEATKYLAKPFSNKKLRKDSFLRSQEILVLDKVSEYKSLFMYQFICFPKKHLCCILFWCAKEFQFWLFLVQPSCDKNNKTSCLITYILGTPTKNTSSKLISSVIVRIQNIIDALTVLSLNPVPFTLLSEYTCDPEENVPHECDNLTSSIFSDDHKTISTHKNRNTPKNCVFMIMPYSSNSSCTLKNLKGFHLIIKELDKGNLMIRRMYKSDLLRSHPHSIKSYIRRSASDFNILHKNNFADINYNSLGFSSSQNSKELFEKPNYSNNSIIHRKSSDVSKSILCDINKNKYESNLNNSKNANTVPELERTNIQNHDYKLRSFSETAVSEIDENKLSSEYLIVQKELEENSSWKNKKKLSYRGETPNDESSEKLELSTSTSSNFESPFEMIFPDEPMADHTIAEYFTQGNYAASVLQAEMLQSSLLNSHSSNGWIFHSTYKGVSLLTKDTSNGFIKNLSFLSQMEIPISPSDMWKCVKNPRSRFICDETVKRVKIIVQLSNAQKLIHIYHEASGLLKKEAIDFCLLHTDRKEQNRYYAAFHSVDYEHCPLMNSVTRGILLPSGWVVEEYEGDDNKCKVTYIIQILINTPESWLIQELYSLVPQALHNLNNYLISKPS